MDKLIFHIDVNSAFLSWEAVYRLQELNETKDLRSIPSIVGGDAKQRHGIVLAKSTPAKKFNINTGEPIVQALRKCPSLIIVPARFAIYNEYSDALMSILSDYTDTIEKFSIDEAFLDMTSSIHLFGDPVSTAMKIKKRVEDELHFTVNVGVSSNKLLAKMASDFQKPNMCHTLFLNEIPSKMWPLPVRELYFVGNSAHNTLSLLGIKTIKDLATSDVSILKKHLGEKYGDLIWNYANGIDNSPVEEPCPVNKGYGNSITLSQDITCISDAFQVLLSLSETVGARLRKHKVKCNCITVELKDFNFISSSHQTTFSDPTDITYVIYETACKLFLEHWNKTPLRLMGLRASKIDSCEYEQLSLFSCVENSKLKKLDTAIDQIRSRFGTDSIKRASFLDSHSVCDHSASKEKHNL